MYATSGVTEILGLSPRQLISKSFFYCIQERCLRDAVRCLEGAKSNDSIAYLRFWFRNPLQGDEIEMSGNGSTSSSDATADPFSAVPPPIELEAVVSCTSDGLVVILRRARAPAPTATTPLPSQPVPVYANGLFAAPWALEPVFSYGTTSYPHDSAIPRTLYPEKKTLFRDGAASHMGANAAPTTQNFTYPPQPEVKESGHSGPPAHNLMDTIRDVAVFAWGIVGINRSLEQYKSGTPTGDAQPAEDNPGTDAGGDVEVDNWDDEAV